MRIVKRQIGGNIPKLNPFNKKVWDKMYDTPAKKYTIERNANFYNSDYLYRLNKHHKGVFTQADVNNAFNSIGLAGRSAYFREHPNTGGFYSDVGNTVVLNPDIYKGLNSTDLGYLAHEYSHGMENTLDLLSRDYENNKIDQNTLRQAYPKINTGGDADMERRAINTQLRSILYNQSGLTKEALDNYIDKLSNKKLGEAIDTMHTDYLKSNMIDFKDKHTIMKIKEALKNVASNNKSILNNYV